jgi:hypothetical protein
LRHSLLSKTRSRSCHQDRRQQPRRLHYYRQPISGQVAERDENVGQDKSYASAVIVLSTAFPASSRPSIIASPIIQPEIYRMVPDTIDGPVRRLMSHFAVTFAWRLALVLTPELLKRRTRLSIPRSTHTAFSWRAARTARVEREAMAGAVSVPRERSLLGLQQTRPRRVTIVSATNPAARA